jgi:hypothetical protein
MNSIGLSKEHFFRLLALTILPLLVAGVYVAITEIQALYRFNQAYFSPDYERVYSAPGAVAIALEQAIREDDPGLYAELTALRKPRPVPGANPDVRLLLLLEVSERGYFDYLFFNTKTYERATHHIKKVNDRWVVFPQDAYYYLDSGEWIKTFSPLAALYWSILFVVEIAVIVFRLAAKIRESMYHPNQ